MRGALSKEERNYHIMKAKKIRFSGTKRNRAATNSHAAGQGTTPPQGKLPTVIAVGTAALILAND